MNKINSRAISRRTRRGFTLIELLVVIAIIVILASVLFPAFARARENARRSACQSNLKQMGLAMMQYTQDYSERVPMGCWTSVAPNDDHCEPVDATWMGVIQPYLKTTDIFECPSADFEQARFVPAEAIGFGAGNGYGYVTAGSYAMNSANWDAANGGGRGPGVQGLNGGMKLASIDEPTKTIWVADGNGAPAVIFASGGLPGTGADDGNGNGYRFLTRTKSWPRSSIMAGAARAFPKRRRGNYLWPSGGSMLMPQSKAPGWACCR